MQIREIDSNICSSRVEELCGLLQACVNDGASIGFIAPLEIGEAAAFWTGIAGQLQPGQRRMWVAEAGDGALLATVQLVLAMPANGRHRAEIVKLMVHPAARRRGIARTLMEQAELAALAERRRLLVLDTRSGDKAEPLYLSLGFELAGRIPAYAASSDGGLDSTSVMYKLLESA